ncbi:adenosylcobinamide-GDP ribazoletransferase [Acidisoma sp. 7E03]
MSVKADLASAFGLLTRLPLPKAARASAPGQGVWAWPLVGAVAGLIGGLVYTLALRWDLTPWLSGLLAVFAMVLTTGGFHEDGLADTADGTGGATPERRLAIMKDSRIGSYGVLALIASVALRAGALAAITEPARVVPAVLLAAVAGRAAMPGVLLLSGPARPGGLAASLGLLSSARVLAAWGIAILIGLLCGGLHATALTAAAVLLVALGAAWFGDRRLGGYTGDTLGAAEQITEIAVLLLLAPRL